MSGAAAADSEEITAAGGEEVILNERGYIWGLLVYTDGTNAADASIYDGASGGGNRKLRVTCAGANRFAGVVLEKPIAVTSNISALITGTGASAMVLFSK